MFCTTCATPNAVAAQRCRACGIGLRRSAPAADTAGGGRLGRVLLRPATRPAARSGSGAPGRRVLLGLALYGVPLLVGLVLAAGYYRANWTEPATWYAEAAAAEAIDGFAAAGDYRDADARRDAVAGRFLPSEAAYGEAVAALDAGRHAEAIAIVAPVVRDLPAYTEAVGLLGEARRRQAADLLRQADAAELRRDWLVAEGTLAAVAAADPGDALVTARLARLRRAHAPLVLARDRALYLVGPDGTDERLLTDAVSAAWPTWSPDRTRIAFASPESGAGGIALYVIGVDGTGLRRLAGGLRPYAGPVWSPDGTRIAFAADGGGPSQNGQAASDSPTLRVVEVATERETDLTAGKVANAFYPSWSPDGERLAFVSRDPDGTTGFDLYPTTGATAERPAGEVYVATLATGAIANLTDGRVPHPWRASWSPVDDRLLVYTRDPGMSYDRDRARVVLLDARSGGVTDVATDDERITMPIWSPDGSRIAYVAGEETVVVRALAVGRPATDSPPPTRQFDLATVMSRFLTWSPDGSALIAVAENPEGSSFLVPLDDAPLDDGIDPVPSPVRLAHDADRRHAGAPQWSPPRPAALPGPPSVGGTALDPAPPPGIEDQPTAD